MATTPIDYYQQADQKYLLIEFKEWLEQENGHLLHYYMTLTVLMKWLRYHQDFHPFNSSEAITDDIGAWIGKRHPEFDFDARLAFRTAFQAYLYDDGIIDEYLDFYKPPAIPKTSD